jgi:assimilatory nitrate reductase catalytic subunit
VWRRIPQDACQLHEFAGRGGVDEREALRRLLTKGAAGELVRFEDSASGAVREAQIVDGRLEQVLFMTTTGRLPARDWLADLFAEDQLSAAARGFLLFGQAPGAAPDPGPLVCACLRVAARTPAAAEEKRHAA